MCPFYPFAFTLSLLAPWFTVLVAFCVCLRSCTLTNMSCAPPSSLSLFLLQKDELDPNDPRNMELLELLRWGWHTSQHSTDACVVLTHCSIAGG